MEISVTGHHVNLSEGTRSQIQDEASRLERFFSPLLECHVTIAEEGRNKKANIVVHVHAQTLTSAHEAERLSAAVDGALQKMQRQLKKLHDKRRNHRSGGQLQEASTTEE